MKNAKKANTKQYFFKNTRGNMCFMSYNVGHPTHVKTIKFQLAQIKVFRTDDYDNTKYYTASIQSSSNLNLKFDWDQAFFSTILERFQDFQLQDFTIAQEQFFQDHQKKNRKQGLWLFIKAIIKKQKVEIKKITRQDKVYLQAQAQGINQIVNQNRLLEQGQNNQERCANSNQKQGINIAEQKPTLPFEQQMIIIEEKQQILVQCKLNEEFSKNPLKELWTCFGIYNQYKTKAIQTARTKRQQLRDQKQDKINQLMRKSEENDVVMTRLQTNLQLIMNEKIKKLNTLGEDFRFEPIFENIPMDEQKPSLMQMEMEMMPMNSTLFDPSQYFYQ